MAETGRIVFGPRTTAEEAKELNRLFMDKHRTANQPLDSYLCNCVGPQPGEKIRHFSESDFWGVTSAPDSPYAVWVKPVDLEVIRECPCALRAESQAGRSMIEHGVFIDGVHYDLVPRKAGKQL